MDNTGSLSDFRRIEPYIWRKTECMNGQLVDFDVRAVDLFVPQIHEIEVFFDKVKTSEPNYKSMIAHDFVRDNVLSTYCCIELPNFEELYESMQLRWVMATTDVSSRGAYVLSYDSLLIHGEAIYSWFDFQGQFLHTEIE